MTYRELLTRLQGLTSNQLDQEAIHQDSHDGEFYGVIGLSFGKDFGGEESGLTDDYPVLDLQQ
jgi:hypothetical protein